MNQRYNVALLPTTKSADFIRLAQRLYPLAADYKIGADSLPHITLCQFYASANEMELLWQQATTTLPNPYIEVTLQAISYTSGNDRDWIALLPKHIDDLTHLHRLIAVLVPNPLGKCFKNYDPHLTLINTQDENCKASVAKFSTPAITDKFILSLGLSDEVGQYKEVIYK